MDIIQDINKDKIRKDLPEFNTGDTLSIHQKFVEGNKERVQIFTGVVIQIKGKGLDKTFTVRKIGAGGVAVEKIYPFNTSSIIKIDVVRLGKVRRSRIFYIREKIGKKARIKERITR